MALENGNIPALAKSEMFIRTTKTDITNNTVPKMTAVEIPSEQRMEYNNLLEVLSRECNETEERLVIIHVALSYKQHEEYVKRLILIIVSVQAQWSLLSSMSSPRYIIDMDSLKNMVREYAHIIEFFMIQFNAMRADQKRAAMAQQEQQEPQEEQLQQPLQQTQEEQLHVQSSSSRDQK